MQVLNILQRDGRGRKILWVWDHEGNTGKTQLAKHLVREKNFQPLPAGTTHHLCGLVKLDKKGFLFDLSRSAFCKENIDSTNSFYQALESVKNGILVSHKFAGSEKFLPEDCVVIVFANDPPNLTRLSIDRWDIFHTKLG